MSENPLSPTAGILASMNARIALGSGRRRVSLDLTNADPAKVGEALASALTAKDGVSLLVLEINNAGFREAAKKLAAAGITTPHIELLRLG